jgi:hypothetical protein
MINWLILTATLPANPSGLRVRVWRALKATGAATLREGVYVLPASAPAAQSLRDIEKTIAGAGADAHLLEVRARDEAQERTFRGLFDRSELYLELMQSIKEGQKLIPKAAEAQLHKTLRSLEQQFQQIEAGDFFPGAEKGRAAEALAALRRAIELHLSPDEPAAQDAHIPSLSAKDFQGRTWATRKRPWVDRLASAWLVSRCIDRKPAFLWLADARKCPRDAVGYDFDGAAFTHVGPLVTFEVLARSFGLDAQPAIRRMGELVHYIDVGGLPQDEAPGLELLVRGLQAQHADDDALLRAAIALFDTLHASLLVNAGETKT